MDIISYILSRKYCDNAIVGLGSIRGANCTISNIIHQDGINTVTFKWTGTDGTEKTRDMIVYDGTPIYVWESGNTYHYGDLVIYESQFYRCITENHDTTFDDTKWNEIGSPDGNYDLVQSRALLPARFTAADRKLYFVIDECIFYLWDGTQWVAQTHLVQESTMPTASAKYLGRMYQYIGITDANFTHGYVYECVSDGQTIPTFTWENVEVQPCIASHTTYDNTNSRLTATNVQDAIDETLTIKQNVMQYAVLPTASIDEFGKVYQYVGITDVNYEHNCFYECISDGETPVTYLWKNIGFLPTFTGTQAQWDALTLAQQNQYDIINITDDEEIVDLGVYLRKVKTMPNAEDYQSETVMYVGTTTSTYTRGYIYRSVPSIVSGEIVYNWVRVDTQPSHPYIQSDWSQNDSTANDYIKHKPTLGTASEKNFTDKVRPNSHDLVESNAVYNAISSSIASIYKPHGDLTCAQLTSDLLIATNIGNVYNMTDSGTTSALFIQGAGKTINVGDTVGIIQADDSNIMFNLMGSMIDLHDYQKQELTTPLTIDGTQETDVEGALGGLNTAVSGRLQEIGALPTASVDNLHKTHLLTSPQTNYIEGGIYKCEAQGTNPETYAWILINGNGIAYTAGNGIKIEGDVISTDVDYVTPQMYGAVGDGVTDDTDAVVAALNSNAKRVYFPEGTYWITWNHNIIPNRDLLIFGDGKDKSVIKFDNSHAYQGTQYGGGLCINAESIHDFEMRDIGLVYENNDAEAYTYPSQDYSLLRMGGRFKNITLDNVWFHLGGSAASLPKDTCAWLMIGAKGGVYIHDCLFENFTNNDIGGNLWINPSTWWSGGPYKVGELVVTNNIFRNTNRDESLAFWGLQGIDGFLMKNIHITNNVFIHKDWNGTNLSKPTPYIISLSAGNNINAEVDMLFSGNTIVVEKSRLAVINVKNLVNAIIAGNNIIVNSVEPTSGADRRFWIINCMGGYTLIQNNYIRFKPSEITIAFPSTLANIDLINNHIITATRLLTSFYDSSAYQQLDESGVYVNWIGNTIEYNGTSSSVLDIIKGGDKYKFSLLDNNLNGKCHIGQSIGSGLIIKGNNFNCPLNSNNTDVVQLSNTASLEYSDNNGMALEFASNMVSSPIANFKFVGLTQDLKFKVSGSYVDDSSTTRARFFTNNDIVYINTIPITQAELEAMW